MKRRSYLRRTAAALGGVAVLGTPAAAVSQPSLGIFYHGTANFGPAGPAYLDYVLNSWCLHGEVDYESETPYESIDVQDVIGDAGPGDEIPVSEQLGVFEDWVEDNPDVACEYNILLGWSDTWPSTLGLAGHRAAIGVGASELDNLDLLDQARYWPKNPVVARSEGWSNPNGDPWEAHNTIQVATHEILHLADADHEDGWWVNRDAQGQTWPFVSVMTGDYSKDAYDYAKEEPLPDGKNESDRFYWHSCPPAVRDMAAAAFE